MNHNPKEYCEFCSNFSTLEAVTGRSLKELVIISTKNFIVVPDIAPLIEGHILIVPKTHCFCIGECCHETFNEFVSMKVKIERLLQETYSGVVFFEHGASSCSRVSGGCIDHAHMHCIPTNLDLKSHISELSPERISSISELYKLAREKIPYMFIESPDKSLFVYKIRKPTFIVSQYLRWVTANALGIDPWNWREITAPDRRAVYEDIFLRRILNTVGSLRKTLSTLDML